MSDEQVKRLSGYWDRRPVGFLPDGRPVALNAGGLVVPAQGPRFAQPFGEEREPANRTILHWMPTEYMEAARAAQGMFDALAVVEAERVKVLQAAAAAGAMMGVAVALAEEALRQHEAPEPVEDGAWIVTVADLRETRRGKRIGNIGPVYDFEEVP